MINLYDLLINFLFLVGVFVSFTVIGFMAWLVFSAWLDAKRERERAKRLERFREQARRDKL